VLPAELYPRVRIHDVDGCVPRVVPNIVPTLTTGSDFHSNRTAVSELGEGHARVRFRSKLRRVARRMHDAV